MPAREWHGTFRQVRSAAGPAYLPRWTPVEHRDQHCRGPVAGPLSATGSDTCTGVHTGTR
jgi:hypothetical protein